MIEKVNETTGNTIYFSDDGRFSSMTKKAVKCWDETMTGKAIEKRDLVFWKCAGNLIQESK